MYLLRIIAIPAENPESGLADFLEQIALVSDIDSLDHAEDRVVLMTIHAAKGLEFTKVFIVGMEEGLFPSYRSLADPMDTEEERRLAYVAITRAKRSLHITTAKQRLLYGATQRNQVSRFAREIPEEYIFINHSKKKKSTLTPFKKKTYLADQIPRSANNCQLSTVNCQLFKDGDKVTHKVFGDGTVLDVQEMGNDSLLEVAFDKVGTKKIMANFAKIEKI